MKTNVTDIVKDSEIEYNLNNSHLLRNLEKNRF